MMKKIFILSLLMAFITISGYSQNNLSVSTGFAVPELVNAGIRYQLDHVKLGISAGTAFTGSLLFSGDVYYHFAGVSELVETPPWYIRGSFSYWPFGKLLFVDLGEAVLLSIRVGREFNIAQDFGINMDAGIIPLSFVSGNQVPFSFIPALSFGVFYRLGDF